MGQPPTNSIYATQIYRFHKREIESFAENHPGYTRIGTFRISVLFQFLAKIAYSYAAAEIGTASLFPMLVDFIKGRSDKMTYLIGGENTELPQATYGHRLELHEYVIGGITYVIVLVHLFGCMGMPQYHIVVSQKP